MICAEQRSMMHKYLLGYALLSSGYGWLNPNLPDSHVVNSIMY